MRSGKPDNHSLSRQLLATAVLILVAAMLPLVIGSACKSGCSDESYVVPGPTPPAGARGGRGAAEEGSEDASSGPYLYWEANLWAYTYAEFNQNLCDLATSLGKSGKLFAAVRFPTQGLASGSGVRSPIVHTPGLEPRIGLVDYTQGSQHNLSAAGKPAPERLAWIRSHLPQSVGTDWDALQIDTSSVPVCPNGIQIGSGKWELHAAIKLDYGGAPGCSGCEGEYYLCYEGQESPLSLAAAAAMRLGVLDAVRAEGITCVGPTPFRLVDRNSPPSQTFKLSGGNTARSDSAPVRIVFPHYLDRLDSGPAINVTLTPASSSGLTWTLYFEATGGGPDYSKPVVAPISLAMGGAKVIYSVCDIPAGFSGLETLTITGVSDVAPSKPVRAVDYVWIGPWTPPPPPAGHSVWLQVASHAAGANQSQWRTDLGLLNTGSGAATATLRLHLASGVLTRTLAVQAGQQLILQDVVDSFAVSAAGMIPAATGSAALEVVSDQPLKVSSRTYNLVSASASCYPGGTFGQNYDAFASEQGIAARHSAYLPQLTENAAYRTNIALTNTGSTAASARVDLFDGAGTQVGSYNVDLNPGQYKQENRPFFNKAGLSNLSRGWAQVWVTSGSGVIASASVVDNRTNDPTTMPALQRGSTRMWLQVASHAAGANQSQWRTDLGILNTDTEPANVQVRFHTAGGVKSSTVSVAPGQQAILVDVVGQIPETGSAALEIVADRPVWASSRTYNLVAGTAPCYPGGTFGQNYDAFLTSSTLETGAIAYLTQLQENSAYRTNIALTNSGSETAKVAVTLFDGTGGQVGQYTVDLNPGQYKQENRPFFSKAGQSNLLAGYARISVTQGAGIIASASVVDNLTNDPTTMPAL